MAELYEDLLKDSSESFEDGNYFLLTITELELGTIYPLEFRWKYKDGTLGKDWSAVYNITTPFKTAPGTPQFLSGNVVGGAGSITVEWNGKDSGGVNDLTNIDRVEVWISEPPFDSTKPVYSSKTKFKTQIPAPAGTYTVALYAVTVNGQYSSVSSAFAVNVTSPSNPVTSPETPEAPTARAGLASVIVEWSGKKTGGGDLTTTGFAGAKVYIGTSAGFTPSDNNWVHTLNFANGSNRVAIGVGSVIDKSLGTTLTYGTPYYVKIDTINANGTSNNNPVAASGVPVTVSKLPASEISTGILTAEASITAGIDGGARAVLSGGPSPFIIYGTDGATKLLEFIGGATGTLAINGGGTFTGNLSIGSGNTIFKAEPATGIWLGNATYGSAPFRVSTNGALFSSSGDIAGWQINPTFLQNTSGTFKISSTNTDPQIQVGSDTGGHIRISAGNGIGHYSSGTTLSNKFTLSPTGTSQISGWTIGADSISSPSGNVFLYSAGKVGETNLRIQAGTTGQFKVYDDGSLFATSAEITGSIKAGSNIYGSKFVTSTSDSGARIEMGNSLNDTVTKIAMYDSNGAQGGIGIVTTNQLGIWSPGDWSGASSMAFYGPSHPSNPNIIESRKQMRHDYSFAVSGAATSAQRFFRNIGMQSGDLTPGTSDPVGVKNGDIILIWE